MRVTKNGGKILWGLFFILAGCYLIAGKIWDLPDISAIGVVITVFCIWVFVKGILRLNFYEILFPIAVVCIVYDDLLGITELTPWPVLGAALLGSIGLSMIFKSNKKSHFCVCGDGKDPYNGNFSDVEQCSGERVRCENNFGSQIKYINSENFCSATLENNFGSLNVYFDNAIIQGGQASVSVENNFGETVLYIPKQWKVENNISRAFGSVSEVGRYEGSSESVLYLQGECNFGSVEIHYV